MSIRLVRTGRENVATNGKSWGIAYVSVKGFHDDMKILVTPQAFDGPNDPSPTPNGFGPLFHAWCRPDDGGFWIFVHDFGSHSFNVNVVVDWLVVG